MQRIADFEPLLAQLPQSLDAVQKIVDTLNFKDRNEYAAKLALKFKDDPAFRPLVQSLLQTEPLGETIPIQKSVPAAPAEGTSETAEGAVQPVEIEQVKVPSSSPLFLIPRS
jgi:hypothetical protein